MFLRRAESRRLAQVKAEGTDGDQQRSDVVDIGETLSLAYHGEESVNGRRVLDDGYTTHHASHSCSPLYTLAL